MLSRFRNSGLSWSISPTIRFTATGGRCLRCCWERAVASVKLLGLRWDDLDYERRTISINHSLVYYPVGESRSSVLHISTPKTDAGIRTIPMLDTVKDAFEMLHEEQKESGW